MKNFKLILRQSNSDIYYQSKVDKKIIEPTPIIQLIVDNSDIIDSNSSNNNSTNNSDNYTLNNNNDDYLISPYLYINVSLITNDKNIKLSGTLNQSIYKLKDFNQEMIGLFLFNDLTLTNLSKEMQHNYTYQLKFTLYHIMDDVNYQLSSICTPKFQLILNNQLNLRYNYNTKLNDLLSNQGMKLKSTNYLKRKRSLPINTYLPSNYKKELNGYNLFNTSLHNKNNNNSNTSLNNPVPTTLNHNARSNSISYTQPLRSNSVSYLPMIRSNSIAYSHTMCTPGTIECNLFLDSNSSGTTTQSSRSSSIISLKSDQTDYKDFSLMFKSYLQHNRIIPLS
ncbi:hypothetical protein K502DRAFT_351106 [Neoconidiobolus thromboides FSU 785]|nr:hypothetical protein K502DRAFT_351106 [Neoconidiobolus thromboides FSU 785]